MDFVEADALADVICALTPFVAHPEPTDDGYRIRYRTHQFEQFQYLADRADVIRLISENRK